jgi:hypothetical protein
MTDLTTVLNADRLAFAEIAQAIQGVRLYTDDASVLGDIQKQCEDRIIAIDAALKDV